MSDVEELQNLIDAGKLTFDSPNADLLRNELLGIPPAEPVTDRVRKLVLEICRAVPHLTILISSLIRDSGHHGVGRAVDIGNEEIAGELLPLVATQAEVDRLYIDEIIFDASVAGESDRNRFNFDLGQPHSYDDATLRDHRDHMHFAVRE